MKAGARGLACSFIDMSCRKTRPRLPADLSAEGVTAKAEAVSA